MNTERTNQDAADRKIDEWADESRQQQGEATAVESRPPEQDSREGQVQQPSESTAPSTADLARAGSSSPEPQQQHTPVGVGQSTDDQHEQPAALFAEQDASAYRDRWQDVQTQFVDDPRQAVQRADALVAQLMQELAETFASERSTLEQQWDRGSEVSTEDLRVTLRRYRSFFDRLLSL